MAVLPFYAVPPFLTSALTGSRPFSSLVRLLSIKVQPSLHAQFAFYKVP